MRKTGSSTLLLRRRAWQGSLSHNTFASRAVKDGFDGDSARLPAWSVLYLGRLDLHGIRLIGLERDTLTRVLLTVAAIGAVLLLRAAITGGIRLVTGQHRNHR